MFKKLKEKITEEVKISPQRFQQLTQSVSDKLQGTSAPEENMFSIGEDDENMSNTNTDQGFSSVTLVSPSSEGRNRRLSNSSMASDISFLPKYEASSLYHLQSDLDASASELEDNVSQSSSQLGHVSKEQVYSAFQKSQMRYHKYRGRYTDLARHYKELERENAKMKSVLVETQDKAIRRVTELKEQCALEQKAKAHLESALRDDLDEKQMKIQSLQTKIELLRQGQSNGDNNVDVEQLTKYLNDARAEIEALNNKIQENKAGVIIFQSKEHEYRTKIAALEKDIASFSEREKENNIKLAENKMELHNELISKDSELSRLKQEIESLRAQDKESKSTKMENLQSQNNNLIEKLEKLTQKCNGLENELLKVEKYKMDIKELSDKNLELTKMVEENNQLHSVIDNLKVGLTTCQENLKRLAQENQDLSNTIQKEKDDYQNQIQHLRESAQKGLISLEKQIADKLRETYDNKEATLKVQFERKLKEISLNNQSATDMQLQLIEKDGVIKDISNELREAKEKLVQNESQYRELESNHLELIEESSQLRSDVNNLKRQISEDGNENSRVYEEKIGRLQANIKTLHEDLEKLEKISQEKENEIVMISKENLKLQTDNIEMLQKYRLIEEKQESMEVETTECNLLEIKLQALEEEKKTLLDSFEMERKLFNKLLEEHNQLKVKEIEIAELEETNKKLEEKVIKLKGYLKEKENSIVEVNKMKLQIEQELRQTIESLRIMEERDEAIEIDKTECNLLQIKVQQLENEKENLLKSFESEREVFDQSFHKKSSEFNNHKEEIMAENVSMAKENLELKKINDELFAKVRIIEERDQVVELETTECNLMKLKLQQLEKEKAELLQGFEMEREMFNKMLVEHKELQEREQHIKDLVASNQHLTEKVAKLKAYLKQKEDTIVNLHKDSLNAEQEIAKLKEALKINEEQISALEIEKSECGLLMLKLKALEEENKNLLNSFEVERTTFEEALSKGTHIENKIDELNQQIIQLTREKDELEEAFKMEKQNLFDSFELERKNFQLTDSELRKVNRENELLKEEKDHLNEALKKETGQINVLKEEVNRLQQGNEKIEKELNIRQENLDQQTSTIAQLRKEMERNEDKFKNMTETLNKEKTEKKEAMAKLKEMQQELDKNNGEIKEIKTSLEAVEKLYNDAKSDCKLLDETRRKLNEIENEKLKLDKDLKKKTDEFQFKVKEMSVIEQQFSVLNQDKNSLSQDYKQIKEKCDELTRECDQLRALGPKAKESEQLKKQNEAVQKECEKLNQEISELKVRINQLSSDNRNVNEEHDRVVAEAEGYKAKCEFLENEKGGFEKRHANLEKERDSLLGAVTDLTDKLEKTTKQIENQSKSANATSNNMDLVQIQQDFLDIKDKCDKLHLENKNLTAEYTKLEEQCLSFSKVKKDLETQLVELERHYNEVLHEKQLLQDEVQELKISPINASNNVGSSKLDHLSIIKQEKSLLSASPTTSNRPIADSERVQREIENLRDKLTQYKSLDITNKSSIEFYENELQKMKNKNEKLNRKLDETLVTLNHCAELSSSTEIEYLRNVLYNYMLGKESVVLARVIAAVCKFDPDQTEAVLQKEQQKQTLLGQLGIL